MSDAAVRIQAKRSAEELLADPTMQKVLKAMRERVFVDWAATTPVQLDERESIYFRLLAVDAFEAELRSIISSGSIEEWKNRARQ